MGLSGNSTALLRSGAMISLLILPLAGCMTQGSSSFIDARDLSGRRNTVEVAQAPLPLDVANPPATASSSGVVNATGSGPSIVAYADPASSPATIASGVPAALEPLDETARRSLAGEQHLQIREMETGAISRSEFAAATPASVAGDPSLVRASALASAPNGLEPVMLDPLEVEAEQRAETMYASMRHGQCKGGWGPRPKMMNAKRIDPSHKYYMEMRLRHTPPLPVGHVYIAYGRIGADGAPLDERLVMLAPVGGYAGATIAAAAPVTGVLEPYGDDCILEPIASYRVTLSAQQYEKLLLRIQQAQREKPKYALWTYNCNHFMSDIAASVGILPPENKYTPSLEYFYAMMDRNEGRKVARSAGADAAQLAAVRR